MANASVKFTLEGNSLTIQCTTEEKMKDICQRYSVKIETNTDCLLFLYGGNRINFESKFIEQANSIDKESNEMNVLVYRNDTDGFICPKCGEKIKLNNEKINDIISSNNSIKDTLNGVKFQIDNIIKNSTNDSLNIQLNNIIIILNSLNEKVKKINDKINNLLRDNGENFDNLENNNNNIVTNMTNNTINLRDVQNNNNKIKGILDIKSNEINNEIILFNTDINNRIDVYLNNQIINMKKENNKWFIDYNFGKSGKYSFQIVFNNIITNMEKFFDDSVNIISLDLTNFDTSNITNMVKMFNNCKKLKEIKGINGFKIINVKDMKSIFKGCKELKSLYL